MAVFMACIEANGVFDMQITQAAHIYLFYLPWKWK